SRRIEVPRIADFTNPSAGLMMWQGLRSEMGRFGHFVKPGGLGVRSGGLAHLPVFCVLAKFGLFSADLVPTIKYSTQLVELC
ncbi:hypothetical protein U9M48_043223, partial [Paspalum notatum var. saurae]